MAKFIVADDHPLFRNAIAQVLGTLFSSAKIIEASDMMSVQERLAEHPDTNLLLLDLHMPGAFGFGALAFVRGHYPDMPVLVVSANDKPEVIQRSIEYGALGFLPKSSGMDTIGEAINTVLRGQKWHSKEMPSPTPVSEDEQRIMAGIATLTPQQYLVLTMLAQGLLNKQIAYDLDVTEATIKAHMTAIFRKLGVRSRTQAVLAISRLHLDPPETEDL